ncbi:MAG: toll/interleukin-1 receptor domain-containing protein [Armatimonadota bacterium]
MSFDRTVCPLCDQKVNDWDFVGRREMTEYGCPRCGHYAISDYLRNDFTNYMRRDEFYRNRLIRCIWEHRDDTGVCILFTEGPIDPPIDGYTAIHYDISKTLYSDDGTYLDAFDRSLINLVDHSNDGSVLTEKNRWDISTINDSLAVKLLNSLIKEGYATGSVDSAWSFSIEMTIFGRRSALSIKLERSTTTPVNSGNPPQTPKNASVTSTSDSSGNNSQKPSPGAPRVFLSHSHVDEDYVTQLATKLEKDDIKVWFAKWDLNIGHELTIKISEGITSSDFLAVILSPDAVKSAWVQFELTPKLYDDITKRDVSILPILYKDCEIPQILKGRKHADFSDPSKYELEYLHLICDIKRVPYPRK